VRDHEGRGGFDAGAGGLDQPGGEIRVQQDVDRVVECDREAGAIGEIRRLYK